MRDFNVKISRLAQGIPVGGEIENLDDEIYKRIKLEECEKLNIKPIAGNEMYVINGSIARNYKKSQFSKRWFI